MCKLYKKNPQTTWENFPRNPRQRTTWEENFNF